MPNVSVIIPAAGLGKRMQTSIPKPLLELEGKTILARTLACFNYPDIISEIIIAVADDWRNEIEAVVRKANLQIQVKFAPGGSERMYSIQNALNLVNKESTYIAVHDAVRPFVTKNLFLNLMQAVALHGACVPGLFVTDTIKIVNSEGFVISTPDRNSIRSIQTPQIFCRETLISSYETAARNSYVGTDDASVVEHAGFEVTVVEGDINNIKITYPTDIERSKGIIKNLNDIR
jgi:2-C-methyl-D-erythritol 4-phosphate cytidylyltransferase